MEGLYTDARINYPGSFHLDRDWDGHMCLLTDTELLYLPTGMFLTSELQHELIRHCQIGCARPNPKLMECLQCHVLYRRLFFCHNPRHLGVAMECHQSVLSELFHSV